MNNATEEKTKETLECALENTPRRYIFVLNGMGGSGKDTFFNFFDKVIPSLKYSSIDLVKECATFMGWDNDKSNKGRMLLCRMKKLFTEYNDAPFKDIMEFADDFIRGLYESENIKCIFVDIREPDEIKRFVDAVKEKISFTKPFPNEFIVKTILVENDNIEKIESNPSDANVYFYNYDIRVNNNLRLENLESSAYDLAEYLFVKEDINHQNSENGKGKTF